MKKPIKGSCTTVLVGKKASIDGSTMISRNDDGHEALDPQRFVVVNPEDQPRDYQAVISGVQIKLPDNPMRYTSIPNSLLTNASGQLLGSTAKTSQCQQPKQLQLTLVFKD